jgi:zinc transport system substrate-binding protein
MRIVPVSVVAVALLAASCAGSGATKGQRTVVSAFYPLAFAAAAIGGTKVHVENLTPPGAEPHDVELSPRAVGRLQQADLVLYLSHDFQPAVEDAAREAQGTRLDALAGLPLREGSEGTDPHVWLDPVFFAQIARRIGAALGRPARAAAFDARLRKLDREYRAGLRDCARREFVTSHAAFGYLAARYGLRQIPITGIDPEAEPSPRQLRDLVELVRREGVTTVFFERLVSPRLAETVAREAGAKAEVLDPIEGLTSSEEHRGDDYFTLMRRNLSQLRAALGCR